MSIRLIIKSSKSYWETFYVNELHICTTTTTIDWIKTNQISRTCSPLLASAHSNSSREKVPVVKSSLTVLRFLPTKAHSENFPHFLSRFSPEQTLCVPNTQKIIRLFLVKFLCENYGKWDSAGDSLKCLKVRWNHGFDVKSNFPRWNWRKKVGVHSEQWAYEFNEGI